MPKNSLPTLGSLDHFLIIPRSLVSSSASLLHYFTCNNSIQCFVRHFATVTDSLHILMPLCSKNCTKTVKFWGRSVSTRMSTIGTGKMLVKLSATLIISVISNCCASGKSGAMMVPLYQIVGANSVKFGEIQSNLPDMFLLLLFVPLLQIFLCSTWCIMDPDQDGHPVNQLVQLMTMLAGKKPGHSCKFWCWCNWCRCFKSAESGTCQSNANR